MQGRRKENPSQGQPFEELLALREKFPLAEDRNDIKRSKQLPDGTRLIIGKNRRLQKTGSYDYYATVSVCPLSLPGGIFFSVDSNNKLMDFSGLHEMEVKIGEATFRSDEYIGQGLYMRGSQLANEEMENRVKAAESLTDWVIGMVKSGSFSLPPVKVVPKIAH